MPNTYCLMLRQTCDDNQSYVLYFGLFFLDGAVVYNNSIDIFLKVFLSLFLSVSLLMILKVVWIQLICLCSVVYFGTSDAVAQLQLRMHYIFICFAIFPYEVSDITCNIMCV